MKTRMRPEIAAQLGQVLRYLFTGGSAFILDFGIMYLLHEVLGVTLWICTTAAGVVAFFYTYLMQRFYTFNSSKRTTSTLPLYVALVLFNLIATILIVELFDLLGSWTLGKIISATLVPLWNYFIYKYLIFKR